MTITALNSSGSAHQAFTLTVQSATQSQGYWLVGGDGGIFTFGSAAFYGSMGSTPLQRPVVAITPKADRHGYWLVASDGGIFAFGDSGFYGSIPGIGLAPAGSPGGVKQLNAPIVGMVPSVDGGGYFMVASDGGVFAFGDAQFSGSCPGIGGCSGAAVAVMPDATGRGYWVVTVTGNVYAFGDAPQLSSRGPGPHRSPRRCGPPTARATGSSTPTGTWPPRARRPTTGARPAGGVESGDGHLRHLGRRRVLGGHRQRNRRPLRGCRLPGRHVRLTAQRPDHRGQRFLKADGTGFRTSEPPPEPVR